MTDSKGTILVVDDEKGVLNLISTILKSAGYETLTAESGYAGYSILEKRAQVSGTASNDTKVGLVIADWRMEGWDGIKLLTELRGRPYGHMPFVLMSGAVTREQLEVAGKKRADAILLKPVVKEALLAKIDEAVERRKAFMAKVAIPQGD